VSGISGAGVCTVGVVSSSVDGECVGGRSNVKGWGRIGGRGEDRGRVNEKGQKE
jgi:hypothetical protein